MESETRQVQPASTDKLKSQIVARAERVKSSWSDCERLQREREGKIRRGQLIRLIMAAQFAEDIYCSSRDSAAAQN
jgi:hypothetical protein